MTSDDGKWEQPTNSDDNARLDSDDHPTLTATPEQIEAGRAMSARADATPTPAKRTTAQGLSAVMPRTPGVNEEIDTANFDRVENTLETPPPFDPKSTARGLLIGAEPRVPANGSGAMSAATTAALSAEAANDSGSMSPADAKRPRTTTANRSGSMSPATDVSDGRVAPSSERRSGPTTLSGLDSRGVRAPGTRAPSNSDAGRSVGERPRNNTAPGASGSMTRSPAPSANRSGGVSAQAVAAVSGDDNFDPASAAGGIVVVATGADGDRVRRVCHAHSLLVPVMSSLSVAHDAMSVVVIGEPSPPAPDRVIHVVRPTLTDAQLAELLRALSSGRVLVDRPAQPTSPDPRAREFAQRIARMSDRASIETTMIEALTVLVDADRAYCWFFDPSSGALWSEGQRLALGDNRRAMGGLVGWAAHTGQAIHATPAGDDARFLLELDDPDGKPQSRTIVQPIIGGDRRVHAVLVAVRRWRNTPFDDTQLRNVADLAALCGPALDIIASTGPRGPKFRPANTIPGPLANAARDSAVVDARSKRPSSRPPPLTARPATTPPPVHPLTATLKNIEAARAGQAPKKPPAPLVPPRITPSSGTPVAPAPSTDASDSRRLRASTKQPPTTSNTGRTRPVTGGERTSGPLRARPFQQVALVATEELYERAQRVAKTWATDVAIVSDVALAPPDARIITIGQAWSPSMDPRVVYVARETISNDALVDLITSIASGRVLGAAAQLTKPTNPNEARRAQQAFTASRTFAAASNLAAAETSAVATMRELLDADRAYLLFYDDADGSLRSTTRGKDERRAIAGMAGWVARTGRAASTERATTDPRWLGPIDDPDGDPNSQLIIEPVIVGDRVRAVLVAARRPRRPGFVDADVQLLARFAALLAPLLDQLLLHADSAPAPQPAPSPAPVARTKRATEQAADDLRAVLPIWQRLPMWSYAAAASVVLLLIAVVASC
jgi:GAF domain-containing protein